MAHVAIHLPWSDIYIYLSHDDKNLQEINRSSWGFQIPQPTAPCFVLFPSSCLPKLLFSIKQQKKTRVHIGMKQHAAILRSSDKLNILRIRRFRLKSPLFGRKQSKTNIYEKLWVIDDGRPQRKSPHRLVPHFAQLGLLQSSGLHPPSPAVPGGQGKREKSRADLDQKHMFIWRSAPPPPVKVMVVL